MKCCIKYKDSEAEWVLATQLEPWNEPLPSKPEDIPEEGVKAWIKFVSRPRKLVTISKVECKFSILILYYRYEK